MFRASTNTEWIQLSNLTELKNKEGHELRFIHSGELEGYTEIFIITGTKKFIEVICADDPYHDVEMALDTKNYQDKISRGEIKASISPQQTFLGIEILESLGAVKSI